MSKLDEMVRWEEMLHHGSATMQLTGALALQALDPENYFLDDEVFQLFIDQIRREKNLR